MAANGFDPFKSRLARDIRNSLSRSFLNSLERQDVSPVEKDVAEHLQQSLPPACERYVRNRLGKYKKAFARITQEKPIDFLQQAAILWDLALYFEMHELLEPEWKQAAGDRRMALQGLIRAAGMKVHAENNNTKAVLSMAAKALAALVKYGGQLSGSIALEAILAEIRHTLAAAANNGMDV